MALVSCPECGASVSLEAKSCPQCGKPIKVDMGGCGWFFLIVAAIVCAAIVIALGL